MNVIRKYCCNNERWRFLSNFHPASFLSQDANAFLNACLCLSLCVTRPSISVLLISFLEDLLDLLFSEKFGKLFMHEIFSRTGIFSD